jgi:transcriptional regulator with XRE-family HTH domain
LLVYAGQALKMGQARLGERLGVSRRTVNRWTAHGITFSPGQASRLAALVHPANRALAARIAATQGETLESLGLEKPAPPAPPPAPPPEPPRYAVDVVVCAAAEALDVSPRAVRPALLAAFQRAREAGLTIEHVEKALTPPTKATTRATK